MPYANLIPQQETLMNNTILIAKKEWKDIIRSKTFIYVVLLLAILTLTSLIVSVLVFNSQLKEYNKALLELRQMGKEPTTPVPELYPLNLLRGVVDYIEIIGAILGILLGYISISKERNTKALKLLLTRPITKGEIMRGKIIGNSLFILVLMSIVGALITIGIYIISGVMLSKIELLKILFFIILSTMYILIFFMLSFFFSLRQKNISNALITCFIIWLVVVLILPQIGDTMDPDNQVPGGFFKSMNIDKPAELKIMSRFGSYETIRNGIEESSITKHYERAIFALFGIKTTYNGVALSQILSDNIANFCWIIGFVIIGYFVDYIFLLKNKTYLRG
jgi:ABC-2 type transport system permease protein